MNQLTAKQVLGMSINPIVKAIARFRLRMLIRSAERDIDLYKKQIEDAQEGMRIRSMDCALYKSELLNADR